MRALPLLLSSLLLLFLVAAAPASAQSTDSTWYRLELVDETTAYGTLSVARDGMIRVRTETGSFLLENLLAVRRYDEIPPLDTTIALGERGRWTIERRSLAERWQVAPTMLRADTLYAPDGDTLVAIPLADVPAIHIHHGDGFAKGLTTGLLGGGLFGAFIGVVIESALGNLGGSTDGEAILVTTTYGAAAGGALGALIGLAVDNTETVWLEGTTARIRLAEIARLAR